MEDVNIMEIGKRYIVAGVSGAFVYATLWHAPFAIVGMQVAVEAALGLVARSSGWRSGTRLMR